MEYLDSRDGWDADGSQDASPSVQKPSRLSPLLLDETSSATEECYKKMDEMTDDSSDTGGDENRDGTPVQIDQIGSLGHFVCGHAGDSIGPGAEQRQFSQLSGVSSIMGGTADLPILGATMTHSSCNLNLDVNQPLHTAGNQVIEPAVQVACNTALASNSDHSMRVITPAGVPAMVAAGDGCFTTDHERQQPGIQAEVNLPNGTSRNNLGGGPPRQQSSYADALRVGTGSTRQMDYPLSQPDVPVNIIEKARSDRLRKEAAIIEKAEASTVWLRRAFNIPNDQYLEAVGKVVGDHRIVAINTDDRSRVELMLTVPECADRLVAEGVILSGEWFKVYRVAEKPVKVTLSKVPPYIPHSSITEALENYGSCTPADCEPVHAYSRKNSQKHIITYKRNVWLRVEKGAPKLPDFIVVYFAGRPYTIQLGDGAAKCYGCGKTGHIKSRCPSNSPNFEPIQKPGTSRSAMINKLTVETDMSDINSWRSAPHEATGQSEIGQEWITIPLKTKQGVQERMQQRMRAPEKKALPPRSLFQHEEDGTQYAVSNRDLNKTNQARGTAAAVLGSPRLKSKPTIRKNKQRSQSSGRAPSGDFHVGRPRKLSLDSSSALALLKAGTKEMNQTPSAGNLGSWPPYATVSLDPQQSFDSTENSGPSLSLSGGVAGEQKADNKRYERPFKPNGAGKNEKKRIIKLGESFQKAMKPAGEGDLHHDDPLFGMPIKTALEVYNRNLPFFAAQKIFDGIGEFLDRIASHALMDSSDDLVRMARKRGVPSTTSSDPGSETRQGAMRRTRSSKRLNDQNSPQKQPGTEVERPQREAFKKEKLIESETQNDTSAWPDAYEDDEDQIPCGQSLPKESLTEVGTQTSGLQEDQPSSV